MEKASTTTNIIILDACRDNPYEKAWNRSIHNRGLAPMYAPKGTLIAFATSPGQTASDGVGKNGLYTSALLAHIEDENIPIEELFKRVRNTVSAFSNGKQISWEHTSLTGNFYFNSGYFISANPNIYSEKAVADNKYTPSNTTLAEQIINSLKNYNWGVQNPAIDRIRGIDPSKEDRNTLFVLGRNILQAACGSSFSAITFIKDLSNRLKQFTVGNENHVLNGILFEVYFDAEGKFRHTKLKSYFIDEVFSVQTIAEYQSSIQFIQEQLAPFQTHLFVVPHNPPQTISIDIVCENINPEEIKVVAVRWEGQDILKKEREDSFFGSGDYNETLTLDKLKERISSNISVPRNQIFFNVSGGLNDNVNILFPFGRVFQK